MKNVVLLFGGKSCEHDISIITGMQALNELKKTNLNILPVYITKNNKWKLVQGLNTPQEFLNFNEKNFKDVFLVPGSKNLYQKSTFGIKAICEVNASIIACHGLNGEDGTVQGLFELCDIPYSSCSVCSSALSLDKIFMKQILEVNNFPITKYVYFSVKDFIYNQKKILSGIKKELEFPLIVKPANLGSSIGIKKCLNLSELEHAITIAQNYDSRILVEEVVPHLREFNCAVLGYQADITVSSVEEVTSWKEFLDFKEKYIKKSKTAKKQKRKIPQEIQYEIKRISKAIFKCFSCSGVIRIDFLYNEKTDELFVNEINSIPGALASYCFKNLSFVDLLEKLIYFAEEKQKTKERTKFVYESAVLGGNHINK